MAKSLLFLPDISGFTEFVNSTAPEHSQHIISELLDILIKNNVLDLQLAEIEGDALFFYREGPLPTEAELIQQAEQMYLAFHNHLQRYEHQRICDCGACKDAVDLELKFFAHAGDLQYIELSGFKKPHGKEVIAVHRLMKNSVPLSEYLLLSQDLVNEMPASDLETPLAFVNLSDTYDAGTLEYQYAHLDIWRSKVALPINTFSTTEEVQPMVTSQKIEQHADKVFELVSNFKYRGLWNKETQFIYEDDRVNRVGYKHQCIVDDLTLDFETVTKEREGAKVFGERTYDIPLLKQATNYFVVSPGESGTEIKIETHLVPKNWLGRIVLPFLKNKLKRNLIKALGNLKVLAETPMSA